jgi:hypothetical protein
MKHEEFKQLSHCIICGEELSENSVFRVGKVNFPLPQVALLWLTLI